MLYYSIVFLCTAALFMALLEDRFRFLVTVGVTAGSYVLALVLAAALQKSHPWGACFAGAGVFFLTSLVLYSDNPLQKLFVAFLCVCNYAFAEFFVPVFLGVMPFRVAGGFGGVASVLLFCLLTLFLALCLYHPLHHFADRGVSGFLIGMFLLLLVLYGLCRRRLDFLFRGDVAAERVLLAAMLYGVMIFSFRSIYQAGRFKTRTVTAEALDQILKLEHENYTGLMSAIHEVRTARRESEYALDTVSVMITGGEAEKVPAYINSVRRSVGQSPAAVQYHEDPYLNAIIAMKASFAAQNKIAFSCSVTVGKTPLSPMEICVIVNEMLAKAGASAAGSQGERRLKFAAFSSGDSLMFEAVYSSDTKKKSRLSLTGKKLGDLREALFEDYGRSDELEGLEFTRGIVQRFSGSLTVSDAGDETILQAQIRF